jgi:hypothetical protein
MPVKSLQRNSRHPNSKGRIGSPIVMTTLKGESWTFDAFTTAPGIKRNPVNHKEGIRHSDPAVLTFRVAVDDQAYAGQPMERALTDEQVVIRRAYITSSIKV